MAGRADLRVDAGSTLDAPFIWYEPLLDEDGKVVRDAETGEPVPDTDSPIDLTGCTARLHVRRNLAQSTPDLVLTTENGGIELGGALGTIRIYATPTQTAALKSGVFDLELVYPNGRVKRLFGGKVRVSGEVTR